MGGFGRSGDGLDSAACADPRLLRSHSATGLEAVGLDSGMLESGVGVGRFKLGFAAGRGRSDSASTREVSISPGCA